MSDFLYLIYYKLKYGFIGENSINRASRNGDVQFLEWFKNSGYEFKYDNYAIFYASENGHVHVLEWFKNSGYEFKYDKNAINYASSNGHIKVLKFCCINLNIKKLIKWSSNNFIKTIKFKTYNKYLKGYQKN